MELFLNHRKHAWIAFTTIIFTGAILFATFHRKPAQVISPNSYGSAFSDSKTSSGAHTKSGGEYSYTEAPAHIGEYAKISGTVVNIHTSKSGTVFLDFCSNSRNCPFSAVIFPSDAGQFSDIAQYQNHVTITGTIKSYQGRAEIIISPDQITL